MRALLVIACAALFGCSESSREILLEVDADIELISSIESVGVTVLGDGETETDHLLVDLTGTKPNCFPFSAGVAPKAGNELLPVGIRVTATKKDDTTITKTVDTTFGEDTRYLLVNFAADCLDGDCSTHVSQPELQAIDRDEAQRRIDEAACKQQAGEVDPLECADRGGCYFQSADSRVCRLPCPEPAPPPLPAVPPAPPDDAARPMLEPCPRGWSASGDPAICAPWPIDQAPSCAPGQAQFPSTSTCADIGRPCPNGQYTTDIPSGQRVYVDPAAMPGGDGSSEMSPLQTISEALGTGASVILLAKGMHASTALAIDHPLAMIGACARETIVPARITVTAQSVSISGMHLGGATIDGGAVSMLGVELSAGMLVEHGGSVGASEISIRGTSENGIDVSSGGTVTATLAFIEHAATIGVDVAGEGSRIELSDAAIVHIDGDTARSVQLDSGGELRLDATILEDAHSMAVDLDHAKLTMTRSLIRKMIGEASGGNGMGIRAAGGELTLSKTAIVDTRYHAIYANAEAIAHLDDLIIVDVAAALPSDPGGHGLLCSSSCAIDGHRVFIERATRIGIRDQARMTLTDLTIRDTRDLDGEAVAIEASDGSITTLVRARLEQSPRAALRLTGVGTTVDAESVIIPDPGAKAQGLGIEVEVGAHLILKRASIDGASEAGIRIFTREGDQHAAAEIEDLIVRDTKSGNNVEDGGYGIQIGGALGNHDNDALASFELTRALLQRNHTSGIGMSRADPARLESVRVEGTRHGGGTSDGGVGMAVTGGSHVIGSRIELVGNEEAGLFAGVLFDETHIPREAFAELDNFVAEMNTCAEDGTGCNYLHGSGAGTGRNGRIKLTSFALHDNKTAGLYMFMVGEVDLFDGVIEREQTGALIPIVGYDLGRVLRGVLYRDNGANIQGAD